MRKRLTLTLALSLLASSILVPAALAQDNKTKTNHVDYYYEHYGLDCEKYDTEMGPIWVADNSYELVVLKSSGDNDMKWNVAEGATHGTTSGKNISHIIVCGPGDEDGGEDPYDIDG